MTTSDPFAGPTRSERDSFGAIDVPADRLWGAQTQRSLGHFDISGERMPVEIVRALVQIKRASAIVNRRLASLDAGKSEAIVAACDEALEGKHRDEFPLLVWQTGSGTQSNMNVNEVIANRASELMGGAAITGMPAATNSARARAMCAASVTRTTVRIPSASSIGTATRALSCVSSDCFSIQRTGV